MKNLNNIEVIDHEVVKPKENIIEETIIQCIKCFKPIDEIQNCDMCNWHTEFYPSTEEQIKVNFINVDWSIL